MLSINDVELTVCEVGKEPLVSDLQYLNLSHFSCLLLNYWGSPIIAYKNFSVLCSKVMPVYGD